MAMTTCPNCGKQLRPGAKFCGSCGATLPAGSAGKAAAPAAGTTSAPAGAQPPADTMPCPNCGKPVRKGAKFCGHCGHTIAAENATAAAPPGAATTLTAAHARTGAQAGPPPAADRHTPAVQPAAVSPPATAAGTRRGLPLLLLAVLAVVCLAAAGGGYFVAARQGWLDGVLGGGVDERASPSAVVSVAITETAPLPASPTEAKAPTDAPTLTPEPTLPPPTDVPSLTQEPTLAAIEPSAPLPSPTAASAALTGQPPTTSAPVTITAPISGTAATIELVLEDIFDGPVSANWLTWGDPIPTIDSGPGYKWLSLKADTPPNAGGVTTRKGIIVFNAPGLEIEFSAAIQDRYPNSKLFMDWDPEQIRRGPELGDPGLIRVGVSKDTATLSAMLTRQSCNSAVDGLQQHRYVVRVAEGYQVELYVDDSSTPACSIESPGLEATAPGRVSFTGRGWLTHVKIMQPVIEP